MEQSALRNTAPPRHAHRFFAYVAVIVLLALVQLGLSLAQGLPAHLPAAFWLFALFAVVADTPKFVQAGRDDAMPVFPSVCFTFAILLEFGCAPAVLVQLIAVIVAACWLKHTLWRAAFNAAQYILSFAAAGIVLGLLGVPERAGVGKGWWVASIVVAAVAWFVVNNLLVSTAVWLRFGGGWRPVFARAVAGDALSTGALLLSAPGLVAAANVDVLLIPLAMVPLFAVRRMTMLSAQRARAARLR